MVRSGAAISLAIVVSVSAGYAGAVRPADRVTSVDPVLNEFQTRVEQYMKLHHKLSAGVPDQKEAVNVAANQASAHTLAARIRVARSEARQGDIFTPAISTRFRQLLNPEVRGRAAADTRATIRDDAPPKFTLHVNDAYPEGMSLPTVPGNVLATLPPLPTGLEYRIVDSHLILRDTTANIIVDYLFDVMCGTC